MSYFILHTLNVKQAILYNVCLVPSLATNWLHQYYGGGYVKRLTNTHWPVHEFREDNTAKASLPPFHAVIKVYQMEKNDSPFVSD